MTKTLNFADVAILNLEGRNAAQRLDRLGDDKAAEKIIDASRLVINGQDAMLPVIMSALEFCASGAGQQVVREYAKTTKEFFAEKS